MAERRALVLISGQYRELPVGDTLAGADGGTGSFATNDHLTATGAALFARDAGLSGALSDRLVETGAQLDTKINQVSGMVGSAANLAATGTLLDQRINLLSGYGADTYATKGSLTQSGVDLGAKIDLTSGWAASAANLAATGGALHSLIAALSGDTATTFATQAAVTATGQAALAAAVSIGSTLSGAIADTGAALSERLDTVANNLTQTGATLIGLINAASAGVASVNGLSGNLTVAGAGNVAVTAVGTTITVSGNTGDYASFALRTDLTASGAALDNRIDTVAGNLAASGADLYARDAAISGALQTLLAALSAIRVTGSEIQPAVTFMGVGGTQVTLSGQYVLISGAAGAGDVTAAQLAATGATLHGEIVGLSGQVAAAYATQTNVTLTGQTLLAALAATGALLSTASGIGIADSGAYYSSANVEGALQEVGASVEALSNANPSPTLNYIVAGGGVALVDNLDLTASATTYVIQGQLYNAPMTNLTADAADPDNPRIDVVAVNTNGAVVLVKGTAAANPVKPDLDPTTQLELTFIYIAAGATSLSTNVVDIYHEGAEWTPSQVGGHFNVASTTRPYAGLTGVEGTNVVAGDYVQFEAPAPVDLANNDSLIFYAASKAAWPSQKQLTITSRFNGTQVGSAVTFKQGTFGFNTANTGYQQIVVPLTTFAAGGQAVNQLRLTCAGGGGSIGMFLDDFTLQGGLAQSADSTRMRWRGPWVETNFYNINDAVTLSGSQFVAIAPGLNHAPFTETTFWQVSASGSAGSVGGVTTQMLTATGASLGAKIDALSGYANSTFGTNGSSQKTLYSWQAQESQPPASNYATFNTRNSIACLEFDVTGSESTVFLGTMPDWAVLSNGITVSIKWAAAVATSGNTVWTSAFERCTGALDINNFASGVESSPSPANPINGIVTSLPINHGGNQIASLTSGDMFRLKLTRSFISGVSTMTGDAQLFTVALYQR